MQKIVWFRDAGRKDNRVFRQFSKGTFKISGGRKGLKLKN